MNSLSNCNCDKKAHILKGDTDCDNQCRHPKPGKAILTCNTSNFGEMQFALLQPPSIQNFNQPIASVTVDTTCFRKKKILVDFAGTITILSFTGAAFFTLTFTLFKTCKESTTRQPLNTFNFSVALPPVVPPQDRALKFEYSSSDDQCEDCCTYTLELSSISAVNLVQGEISINGTLCVLAVET